MHIVKCWLRHLAIATVLLHPAAAPAVAQRAQVAPEAATGRSERPVAHARRMMVAAANPLAVDAGVEMLRAGGSAVDAAIAVQLVLNIVEPQSSGLGGGAFMLHFDRPTGKVTSYDGRETAPASATPHRFLRDGRSMPFEQAVHSGLAIGTPGTPRLLAETHRLHGKLGWRRLFEPALRLAEDGFEVSPRLFRLLQGMGDGAFTPAARSYFFDAGGRPHPIGHRLRSPRLADTLRRFRDGGADGFYAGPVAAALVAAAAGAPTHAGDLTLADLAGYRIAAPDPACVGYRGYRVCGMGPPSSGGIAVGQVLQLLEPLDLGRGSGAAFNIPALHLIAEAEKLAFADRNLYVADPAFVRVPPGLLDAGYLRDRGKAIDPDRAMSRPEAGQPPGSRAALFGSDATRESVGTSHVSIIDADGNAVSLTTTIEAAFGARVMAAGLLLNNQLTDFSFLPTDRTGATVANAVGPGKRPRSSMAPTMIFDPSGKLVAVLGSPGGSRIINYVVKAIVALIDWQLDAQAAAAAPNFGSRGGAFELESDTAMPTGAIAHAMLGRGHAVQLDEMTSGLQIVRVLADGTLEGGADPRREGVARGD